MMKGLEKMKIKVVDDDVDDDDDCDDDESEYTFDIICLFYKHLIFLFYSTF